MSEMYNRHRVTNFSQLETKHKVMLFGSVGFLLVGLVAVLSLMSMSQDNRNKAYQNQAGVCYHNVRNSCESIVDRDTCEKVTKGFCGWDQKKERCVLISKKQSYSAFCFQFNNSSECLNTYLCLWVSERPNLTTIPKPTSQPKPTSYYPTSWYPTQPPMPSQPPKPSSLNPTPSSTPTPFYFIVTP